MKPPLDWIGRLVTEREFQRTCVGALKALGWSVFHDNVAWRSDPGWLDLTCVHPVQKRTVFIELKKESGKVSPKQQEWIDTHTAAGNEVFVFRPSQWDEFVLTISPKRG